MNRIVMIAFLLFSVTILNAQNGTLRSAFSLSYEEEAKSAYTKAIKPLKDNYSENSYEINLRLGWLHYKAGMQVEAISYYQKAINLMPYSVEAKFGYTYPASALGNWNDVLTQYKNILKIDGENSTANYQVGLILYNRKDYTEAKKYFEKVVNLYPFSYDGVHMLAWTNFQLGKFKEAKVLFEKALLIYPTDASAKDGLKLIK